VGQATTAKKSAHHRFINSFLKKDGLFFESKIFQRIESLKNIIPKGDTHDERKF